MTAAWVALEHAEVVVGVLCDFHEVDWNWDQIHSLASYHNVLIAIVINLHLRLIIVAANPLTARTAQSLLASSGPVHNPLVDQALRLTLVSISFYQKFCLRCQPLRRDHPPV